MGHEATGLNVDVDMLNAMLCELVVQGRGLALGLVVALAAKARANSTAAIFLARATLVEYRQKSGVAAGRYRSTMKRFACILRTGGLR